MSSKIEQIITEIEEYIDNCKFQPLSTSKIVVNKDDIDELLAELRLRTPDEIKKYLKIIANKDAILNDAKERSEAMIAEATAHINQLVSEHEIMQKSYDEANMVIEQAQQEAQDILNNATSEANDYRMRAMQYTDDILRNLEISISHAMDSAKARHENYMSSLQEFYDVVSSNRAELNPAAEDTVSDSTENLPKIDISSDMLK